MVTWAMGINTDPGYSRTMRWFLNSHLDLDVTMASDGSPGHSNWYGPSNSMALRYEHGTLASVRPWMITGATYINTVPDCNRSMDPDTVLSCRSGHFL